MLYSIILLHCYIKLLYFVIWHNIITGTFTYTFKNIENLVKLIVKNLKFKLDNIFCINNEAFACYHATYFTHVTHFTHVTYFTYVANVLHRVVFIVVLSSTVAP